jgi:methylglutaconyl-CoA hydratase
MTTELVQYTYRAPAVELAISRPEKRNALSRELIAALSAAFQRAADDPLVRVVILTSRGPAFCAGMDLTELAETIEKQIDLAIAWEDANQLAQLFELIYTLPKPTIAAVQGPAVAGGAGLVSVCDFALATPAAKFGYPEVKRGLVAALVLPHLLRHVGERMARYLLLTGELIDAAQALEWGLINEVVEHDQLTQRADALAYTLADGGPEALAATKKLLKQFSHQALPLTLLAKVSATPRLGNECRQGLKAFFAKQPAPWAPYAEPPPVVPPAPAEPTSTAPTQTEGGTP